MARSDHLLRFHTAVIGMLAATLCAWGGVCTASEAFVPANTMANGVGLTDQRAAVSTAPLVGMPATSVTSAFGCKPGLVWKLVGTVGQCQAPAPAVATGGSCSPAASFSAGACTFTAQGGPHATTVSLSNSRSGYVGSLSMTCVNGQWVGSALSCQASSCPAVFDHRAGACAFDLPASANGASATGANKVAGYEGALSATCAAGAWRFAKTSCSPVTEAAGLRPSNDQTQALVSPSAQPSSPPKPCLHGPASWGACSASMPAGITLDGSSHPPVRNTTPGFVGTLLRECRGGQWLTLASSCAPIELR